MPVVRAPSARGASSKRSFRSFSCATVAEIVERSDTVRLGPHADRAGAADVRVVLLYVAFAVERDSDMRSGEFDAQNMPLPFRDRRIDIFDGDAAAALRVIERNVVFEYVSAN